MPNTVTLHCELGDHDWERVSQRGRRPRSCPECLSKAAPQTPSERVVASGCPAKLVAWLTLPEGANEADRKLHYIAAELEAGGREQADVTMMLETANDIIRRMA